MTVVLETIQAKHWPGYVPAYLILRPLNFAAMRWMAGIAPWGLAVAVGLAWLTYFALPGPISLYSATAIVQGMLYVAFGIAVGSAWPVLSVLWLLLGLFNFGFAAGWQITTWASLNQWWATTLCVVAFSAVAIMEGRHEAQGSAR